MFLSVIIPTYNRSSILRECLEALYHQTLPKKDFEIIVVDDGSTDETRQTVKNYQREWPELHYYFQKNQGQGRARNFAVTKAKGDIIVLIGDDIIVAADFLQEHLRIHLKRDQENEAVLGFTDWYPKIPVSPFMQWLTNGSAVLGRFGGHQFAYDKLEGKEEADFNFFYTSNISLKRSLLEKYLFDPDFSGYGWEDIELGYRLQKHETLRLYYNKRALGYHHHFMTEESLQPRMEAIGRSAWIFQRKHPELKKVPGLAKRFIFWFISLPPFLGFWHACNINLYYYALSKKYFLAGVKKGKEDERNYLRSKNLLLG